MREAVLARIPQAVAIAVHAQLAQAQAEDATAAPARVAAHGMAAGHPAEAARAWHRTGLAARQSGRLSEQLELLEQAAQAYAQAGAPAEQFDALHDALDSRLIRSGGAAMLHALPALERLAHTPRRRLRLAMAQVDALLNLTRFEQALAQAQQVLAAARQYPAWLADALCLYGQALVHNGHLEECLVALHEAASVAAAQANERAALHVASAMAFAMVAAARPADAIEAQAEALRRAQAMGDATGTALAHGNLAATYMVAADPQAGFGHAQAALLLHADMRSDEGVHAAIAAVNFGASAAWLGQLDLAVPALHRALHTLGPHSGAAAMAKASIAAAAVDWMRGEPENGLLQLATVTPPAPAPMVLQAHLWCARCAQALGRARQAQGHVRQARAWWAAQPALWSVPGALADWAPYGNAAAMLGPLHAQAQRCEAERLPGLARGLWFGWLVHASKTDARAALPVALRLLEELSMGFSAGLYPPAVWLALSDVFVRARRSAPAEQARDLALRWLLQARLPDGEQAALRFASANPVNRHLLVTPG